MSRKQKFLAVFLSTLVLFFGFIIVRVWALKPSSTIKLAAIPAGEYDPAVWGQFYPLQYKGMRCVSGA
ncbi:hypothetical protein HA075_17475 [bacterium BFN5]|nr:hypothetical protein HA075_17475 [bacterium BFN5]